jgi:hypothetical protein
MIALPNGMPLLLSYMDEAASVVSSCCISNIASPTSEPEEASFAVVHPKGLVVQILETAPQNGGRRGNVNLRDAPRLHSCGVRLLFGRHLGVREGNTLGHSLLWILCFSNATAQCDGCFLAQILHFIKHRLQHKGKHGLVVRSPEASASYHAQDLCRACVSCTCLQRCKSWLCSPGLLAQ